jgi:hypothetical protein
MDFLDPTFPTQVCLLAGDSSSVKLIGHAGNIDEDIEIVKNLILRPTLSGKVNICIDPSLFAVTGDGERAIESGCAGYLTAPIDKRTFLTDVHPRRGE